MSLIVLKTDIPDVKIIEPRVFRDQRGYFMETFHREKYLEAGIDIHFVQDNHSHSVRGTLRGLHYQIQQAQDKLVYVTHGEIFDVAVDIRRGSPTFGRWAGVVLNSENFRQIFIPRGFAHGFYTISETADVIYKCSDVYAPQHERGIRWDDPGIAIDWPLQAEPLLSDKDLTYPFLKTASREDLPVLPEK